MPPGIASRDNVGALGLRRRYDEDGLSIRASGSRLRYLRVGKATLESIENCPAGRYSFCRFFANCQSRRRGIGRFSREIYHATDGLRFRDAGRGIFGPELRQGSHDRLLRSGQRDRPQKHLQEIRSIGIRFMYRPYVRLQSAGQSTDLSPLPSCA